MRYFMDTEFIERGPRRPVELISLGIVAEDGREYYAISSDFDHWHANDWVRANVLSQLEPENKVPRLSLRQIATEVTAFIGESQEKPEFWGYFADYDWVVFCQIFGTMMDLPKGWPMFCMDLKQLCVMYGNPKLPVQETREHNALADARWNKIAYDWLMDYIQAEHIRR